MTTTISSLHLVHLTNEGQLKDDASGNHSNWQTIEQMVMRDIPQVTKLWDKTRIMLYAHGGVNDAQTAMEYAESKRAFYLSQQIYPIFFIWRSDIKSVVLDMLESAINQRRQETSAKGMKEFLADAGDFFIEKIAQPIVTPIWEKMKSNAQDATNSPVGGARRVAELLQRLAEKQDIEINLVGHSAGGIFHAPLVTHLIKDRGLNVNSVTLWAPGTRLDLFGDTYFPMFASAALQRFALYTLKDADERNDSLSQRNITLYRKSILYLVSNALEGRNRYDDNTSGSQILGMEKFIANNDDLKALFSDSMRTRWVNADATSDISCAKRHDDFDDDQQTLNSTVNWIKS